MSPRAQTRSKTFVELGPAFGIHVALVILISELAKRHEDVMQGISFVICGHFGCMCSDKRKYAVTKTVSMCGSWLSKLNPR